MNLPIHTSVIQAVRQQEQSQARAQTQEAQSEYKGYVFKRCQLRMRLNRLHEREERLEQIAAGNAASLAAQLQRQDLGSAAGDVEDSPNYGIRQSAGRSFVFRSVNRDSQAARPGAVKEQASAQSEAAAAPSCPGTARREYPDGLHLFGAVADTAGGQSGRQGGQQGGGSGGDHNRDGQEGQPRDGHGSDSKGSGGGKQDSGSSGGSQQGSGEAGSRSARSMLGAEGDGWQGLIGSASVSAKSAAEEAREGTDAWEAAADWARLMLRVLWGTCHGDGSQAHWAFLPKREGLPPLQGNRLQAAVLAKRLAAPQAPGNLTTLKRVREVLMEHGASAPRIDPKLQSQLSRDRFALLPLQLLIADLPRSVDQRQGALARLEGVRDWNSLPLRAEP